GGTRLVVRGSIVDTAAIWGFFRHVFRQLSRDAPSLNIEDAMRYEITKVVRVDYEETHWKVNVCNSTGPCRSICPSEQPPAGSFPRFGDPGYNASDLSFRARFLGRGIPVSRLDRIAI